MRDSNLMRLHCPEDGIDLLATVRLRPKDPPEDERILAICLQGPEAPKLPVEHRELGAKVAELSVGMTLKELEEQLQHTQRYDHRRLDDPGVYYRYYRDFGLAVRLDAPGGVVQELVIAQIPDEPGFVAP